MVPSEDRPALKPVQWKQLGPLRGIFAAAFAVVLLLVEGAAALAVLGDHDRILGFALGTRQVDAAALARPPR